MKKHLEMTRSGLTRKIEISNMTLYITVNFFDDHKPAEVFITIAKQGSTLAGFVDCLAMTISKCFKYGIPWDDMMDMYLNQRFEPNDANYPSVMHCIAENITGLIQLYEELWK